MLFKVVYFSSTVAPGNPYLAPDWIDQNIFAIMLTCLAISLIISVIRYNNRKNKYYAWLETSRYLELNEALERNFYRPAAVGRGEQQTADKNQSKSIRETFMRMSMAPLPVRLLLLPITVFLVVLLVSMAFNQNWYKHN